jgi:hypothetical protein
MVPPHALLQKTLPVVLETIQPSCHASIVTVLGTVQPESAMSVPETAIEPVDIPGWGKPLSHEIVPWALTFWARSKTKQVAR